MSASSTRPSTIERFVVGSTAPISALLAQDGLDHSTIILSRLCIPDGWKCGILRYVPNSSISQLYRGLGLMNQQKPNDASTLLHFIPPLYLRTLLNKGNIYGLIIPSAPDCGLEAFSLFSTHVILTLLTTTIIMRGGRRRRAIGKSRGSFNPEDENAVKHTKVGVWDLYEEKPPLVHLSWTAYFGMDTTLEQLLEARNCLPFVWRMMMDIGSIRACWMHLMMYLGLEMLLSLIPALSLWCVSLFTSLPSY